MKKILLVLVVVLALCFAGCSNSSKSTVKTNKYYIKDISVEVPKNWTYTSNDGSDYFYPKEDKNMFYIMNEELDVDNFGWSAFEKFTESFQEADNFAEISKGEKYFNDELFYNYIFSMDIGDNEYYIENYITFFNKTVYSFCFASKGSSRYEEFDNEDAILNSVVFDEKTTNDSNSQAATGKETQSTVEYEKVSTKELYKNSWLYDDEYITTTIKVNKVYQTKGKYGYKVYNTDDYDEAKIIVENYPDNKVKKGDYITFSGLCSVSDDEIDVSITIYADKKEKVNKKLFKTFGGSETKPKPIPQEYINALSQAADYNEYTPMSKKALFDQLTSEYGGKFPDDAAQYAVDNIDADWEENALKEAKIYYEDMNMSKADVYDQLTSEYGGKYTAAEAQYAVDNLDN